ncbi:hypothetical protein TRICHSKD4_0647 [Roseibium sp. TrichSKD4]|nr:hypothetical protein TRICHSKD4_0647 [Roseibium sp. TrichSKD4]
MVSTGGASACIAHVPFHAPDTKAANIVFSGEIKSYRKLHEEFASAVVTFNVTQIYRGNAGSEVTALWQNSTFSVPEDLVEFTALFGSRLVVGITSHKTRLPLRGPSATFMPLNDEELSSLPRILQAPCSDPFMFRTKDADDILTFVEFTNHLGAIQKMWR